MVGVSLEKNLKRREMEIRKFIMNVNRRVLLIRFCVLMKFVVKCIFIKVIKYEKK